MASTLENLHLALPNETSDPQQQLVEVLGLSLVLKERRRFLLNSKAKDELDLPRSRELAQIEASLNISQAAPRAINLNLLHSTQAARRLSFQIRNAKRLLIADQAALDAMLEFPESGDLVHLARRLAYLRALEILDLLPARGARELKLLRALVA